MAVTVNIEIPDAYIATVVNAFNKAAGSLIHIMATKNETTVRWDFVIEPQQPSETLPEFGKRFIKQLGKAIVDMVDYAEDEQRYKDTVATIPLPASDIPDGIFT